MATEPQRPRGMAGEVEGVNGVNGVQKPKPRIYLEPLDLEKHMQGFHELWIHEETLVWFPFPVKKNVEESREFLIKILPNEENPDIDKFAMMLLPTESEAGDAQVKQRNDDGERERNGEGSRGRGGEMIGFVGTNRYKEQGMEVGYVINRRYWGKGFATEGMKMFLDMCWGMENRKYINRLVGKTSPGNIASQNILLKCGARKGEVLKDVHELWVDKGKKSDLICWYLDRPGVGVEELENERERRSVALARMEGRGKGGEPAVKR